jgi:hypothetical protein
MDRLIEEETLSLILRLIDSLIDGEILLLTLSDILLLIEELIDGETLGLTLGLIEALGLTEELIEPLIELLIDSLILADGLIDEDALLDIEELTL